MIQQTQKATDFEEANSKLEILVSQLRMQLNEASSEIEFTRMNNRNNEFQRGSMTIDGEGARMRHFENLLAFKDDEILGLRREL